MRVESVEYWRAVCDATTPDSQELARLNAEENAVLAALLGPQPAATAPGNLASVLGAGLRLGGILEPKRAALEKWCQRLEPAKTALLAITEQRHLAEAEIVQMQAVEAEQETDLARLLTAPERVEFELRNSPSANSPAAHRAGPGPRNELSKLKQRFAAPARLIGARYVKQVSARN